MFIVLCATHLIATEFVPAQRSRGEVLLYQRKSGKRIKTGKDEETGDLVGNSLTTSLQDTAIEMVNVGVKEDSRITATRPQPQKDRAVFHWNSVDYSIQIKKKKRQILQDVEGWVRPGSLTALMVNFHILYSKPTNS